MSFVYVAVGIISLILLQMLRGMLSLEFIRYAPQPVDEPDANSFGGLDLIDAKTDALAALGFTGPAWISPGEESAISVGLYAYAVYCNEDDQVVAWTGPTIEIAQPHQLLTYYSTLLADGRYAVTQVSDPFFDVVADPMTPAQVIPAADEQAEVAAHLQFVRDLGVPVAHSTSLEGVLQFAGAHLTGVRQRLIERKLIREVNGVARPSLRFAFRMIKAMFSRPKSTEQSLAVPASRLPYFADLIERGKERAPAQGMQWLLMLISGFLFIVIGWPLLGLDLTLILLVVIAFHEAGHWLAMRLYGYGNPHITLLPLLGGVTIGHENEPNAARRAWVALAGPLPGIVLGWAMLVAVALSGDFNLVGWELLAIAILLVVNYLNVLPIPPLDGHHVVQAILPPRWVAVQIVLIVIGVAAGAYLAYLLEFWAIAFIAGLQLLGLRSLLRTTRIVTKLAKEPLATDADPDARRVLIFDALEQQLGKADNAAKRIALANSISNRLKLVPMSWVQRTFISAVYAALLVVPVGGMIIAASERTVYDLITGSARSEISALYEELDRDFERLTAEAEGLELETLVRDLATDLPLVPASEEAIEALRRRIGTLPADLESFYRLTDGRLEGLAIGPTADVRRIDPALYTEGELQHFLVDGELPFWNAESSDVFITQPAMQRWWQLGSGTDQMDYTFLDPAAAPGEFSLFLVGESDYAAYPSLTALLRQRWAGKRYFEISEVKREQTQAILEDRLRDKSVIDLMQEFPEPSFAVRIATGNFVWQKGATAEELAALAESIGQSLPGDLVAAWSLTNGHAPSGLLPTASVKPASAAVEYSTERATEIARASGLSESSFDGCWAVGGNEVFHEESEPELHAMTFWCPNAPQAHRFIDLSTRTTADSYTTVLRRRAAQVAW